MIHRTRIINLSDLFINEDDIVTTKCKLDEDGVHVLMIFNGISIANRFVVGENHFSKDKLFFLRW